MLRLLRVSPESEDWVYLAFRRTWEPRGMELNWSPLMQLPASCRCSSFNALLLGKLSASFPSHSRLKREKRSGRHPSKRPGDEIAHGRRHCKSHFERNSVLLGARSQTPLQLAQLSGDLNGLSAANRRTATAAKQGIEAQHPTLCQRRTSQGSVGTGPEGELSRKAKLAFLASLTLNGHLGPPTRAAQEELRVPRGQGPPFGCRS